MLRPFDSPKYEKLKIIDAIGLGKNAIIYSAKFGNEEYAIKIGKLIPEMMKKKIGTIWREIYFYTEVAPKYKKQLKLFAYDYKITNKCSDVKHALTIEEISDLEKKAQEKHTKLFNSKYCYHIVMPLLKGHTLAEYFNYQNKSVSPEPKLSKPKNQYNISAEEKRMYYGWFIDILKQLKFLHSIGYSHNDICPGNIMILIDNSAILIDYGIVDSYRWEKRWTFLYDFFPLIYLTMVSNHTDENYRMNDIHGNKKYPVGNFDVHMKKFLAKKESKIFITMCEDFPLPFRDEMAFHLCRMMMPEMVKSIVVPKKFINDVFWVQYQLIDIEDTIFLLSNIMQPNGLEMVIKKFSEKMNQII